MNTVETVSLYDRLGRFDGITRIVHDVMDAHLANPVIASRFQASKDLDHAKKMAVEFFCAGCDGPACYTGREPHPCRDKKPAACWQRKKTWDSPPKY